MGKTALALCAVAMTACVTEAEEQVAELEQAFSCPVWECGMNSPVINGHKFHDLNESKYVTNDEGFRLVKFEKNGVEYALHVRKGVLVGYDKLTGLPAISEAKQNLVGARMWIVNDKTKEVVIAQIFGVARNYFWAKAPNQPAQMFESYQIMYTGETNVPGTVQWSNLCSNPSATYDGIPGEHTVLIEGDRIDADRKTISSRPDTSWFNFGCAGHAIAKLMLTGHAYAATSYGFVTTPSERQTILKMFVADYTGTGLAYTTAGTPLQWMDDHDWMNYGPSMFGYNLEARWTPNGAACLGNPRHPDALAQMQADVQAGKLLATDIPGACAGTAYEFDGKHMVSANKTPLIMF